MTEQEEIKQLKDRVQELEDFKKSVVGQTCQSCKHFIQHYSRDTVDNYTNSVCGTDGYYYKPINAGHCTTPRIKNKGPMNKACSYFESI